ncbi:sulfatase-like hydrolase/transferase [Devosia rhodophyticola]|uniref:Sulfatase-like hydrolase/transferase n=1 Tax=Devosia rhodophyticola TaxID=3026423 RepID=A0ABY7YV92_9HYPH|nr:sulfatase-like hydrolase/transferase [Devosia rhodophyticola]WDR05231.1 sulfatase-like hydrolase/transferase [Devosia rhodophyticola]
MTKRPNVILISSDQQRGDCIGAETRQVKTPNIDRIGANGVRFSKCITPHPMCQAARASILTGKLPYTHGVRDNGRDLDEALAGQGLGAIFAAAGYDSHFIGKAHFSSHQTFQPTGKPECLASAKDYPEDWQGPFFGFDKAQLMLRPHHHTKWAEPPEALHHEYWLDQDGRGGERWAQAAEHLPPKSHHFQAWRSALDNEWHSSPWIGDRAVELINGNNEKPYFAWVSFPDPHPPFLAPRPWSDMYDPSEVDLPTHFELDLDRRPWWHRMFLEKRIPSKALRIIRAVSTGVRRGRSTKRRCAT